MPNSIEVAPVVTEDRIFELLKRSGPLCMSQIAVDLGLPFKKVKSALEGLSQEGLVERRPDKDREIEYDEQEVPWGLSRPSFANRSH